MSMFKKAERKKIKLKIGITGPSGSGKTLSSLRLARGLAGPNGKIALGDSENGSASLYSDKAEFDTVDIKPPFTVEKYISVIQSAVAAGYDVLILDSISHQWKGEGGILNKKEQMDSRGGNSFTNWGKLTPEQEKFLSAISQSDIHIISTMRSKQEYVLETNDKGKQQPKKVGLAPVQREGMEYEFTVVFDVAMNHEAETSKDRTGLFTDQFFQVSEQTGEKLKAWLDQAPQEVKSPKQPTQSVQDPGEYVLDFGPNSSLTGKKIKDNEPEFLAKYLADKKKWYEANEKLPHPKVVEAENALNQFIGQRELG